MTNEMSCLSNDAYLSSSQLVQNPTGENPAFLNRTDHVARGDVDVFIDGSLPAVPGTTCPIPSKAEWDAQRATITRLYVTEKKILKEVMQYMMSIGFNASENMYKKRIKQWGLDKKFKRLEAIAMLVLQAHHNKAGKSLAFTIRGKDIDQQDLERYVKRAHITRRDMFSLPPSEIWRRVPDVGLRFLPNVPIHLKPPDDIDRADALSHILMSYLDATFESGLCWVDEDGALQWNHRYGNRAPHDLVAQTVIGLDELDKGNFNKAGAAFRLLFWKLESFMHNLDPRYWLIISYIRVLLCNEGHLDIDRYLSKHILSLAGIHLERTLPHRTLVTHIIRLQAEELAYCCKLSTKMIIDHWRPRLSCSRLIIECEKIAFSSDYHWPESSVIGALQEHIRHLKNVAVPEDRLLLEASTIHDLWWTLEKDLRPDPTELAQEISNAARRLSSAQDQIECKILGIIMLAGWNYHRGNYKIAKDWYKELVVLDVEYKQLCGEELWSEHSRYSCFEELDYISNHTDIADGDQQWRRRMEGIEKGWEDELNEAVGDLGLAETYEIDQTVDCY